jgi:pyruvate kinase
MRNAKIVCTLGPASDSRTAIRRLADAGMSVARLNASHGTHEDRAAVLERIRTVDEATERPLAAMVDLAGPEVRTAPLDSPVALATDSEIRYVQGDTATADVVGLSHPLDGVAVGDTVLLDDGRIETTVTEVDDDGVTATVDNGGDLGGRKGVNVPGVDLALDVLTDRDRRDIEVAIEGDADMVAASFVRDAADVLRVEEAIEDAGGDLPVVAKIERDVAVDNVDEIVDASYGVMVARGDLGVECPLEEVPVIQKRIIRRCNESGTPVITATEMLDSMVHERRPTRAEASDVANAVLDGTDAVMLSGETAIGDHPVQVVEAMDRIVREIEACEEYAERRDDRIPNADQTRTDALARSARFLARDLGASAVVAVTESGYTALKAAKYRPEVPVVAATPTDSVRRTLALSWGVTAEYVPLVDGHVEDVIDRSVQAALDVGVAESGDTVVVLAGMMTELEGATTDVLKVHVAAETLATGRSVVAGRAVGPVARASDGDLAALPDGAVLAIPADFDGEFSGDPERLAAVVAERPGMTGYAAMVAREIGIPMISGAPLDVREGTVVTVDGERGVVYDGDVESGRQEPT